MAKRSWGIPLLLGLSLIGARCDEDVAFIRLTLNQDESGTIKVISVAEPSGQGSAETASSGATWLNRVSVSAAAGEFRSISALKVADITFDTRESSDGTGFLEVKVPLGPESTWVAAVAAIPAARRVELAQTFDPDGKLSKIGSSVTLVVKCPGKIVSSGVAPQRGDVAASHEKMTATLTIPVDECLSASGSLAWHITWGNSG